MVSLISVLDILAAVWFLATLWAIRDHRKRGGLPYPPGPRPLPIIGNLLDIPKEFSWLAYTRFSEKYGTVLLLAAARFINLSHREYFVFPCLWNDHRRTEYCRHYKGSPRKAWGNLL
jgi:hypothetical protein